MRVLGCLGTCGPQHLKLTVHLVSFAELLRGLTQGAVPKLPGIVLFTAIVLTMKALGGMHSVVLCGALLAATRWRRHAVGIAVRVSQPFQCFSHPNGR